MTICRSPPQAGSRGWPDNVYRDRRRHRSTTSNAASTRPARGNTVNVEAGIVQLRRQTVNIDKGLRILGANVRRSPAYEPVRRVAESVLNGPSSSIGSSLIRWTVAVDGLSSSAESIREHVSGESVTWTNSIFDEHARCRQYPNNGLFVTTTVLFEFTDNKVLSADHLASFIQVMGNLPVRSPTDLSRLQATNSSAPASRTWTLSRAIFAVHGTVVGNTFDGVDIGVLLSNACGNLSHNNTIRQQHWTPAQSECLRIVRRRHPVLEPSVSGNTVTIYYEARLEDRTTPASACRARAVGLRDGGLADHHFEQHIHQQHL